MADGTRIVLTRENNAEWAQRLTAAGVAVLDLPLVRFAALPTPADPDAARCDWVLFTSPQGVRAFAAAGLDTGGARFAGLGAGTNAAMNECGLPDALGLRTRDGAEFVARFLEQVPRPGRVLLPGPRRRQAEPLAMLAARGVDARELPLYETSAVPAQDLPPAAFTAGDIVFFCSPSAVRAFVGAYRQRPRCVAIGETSARAAREAGFDPATGATPDLDAMVRAAGLPPLASSPETECSS